MVVCSVCSAMMTNPGAVPKDAEPLADEEGGLMGEEGKNAEGGAPRRVRKFCRR